MRIVPDSSYVFHLTLVNMLHVYLREDGNGGVAGLPNIG